MIDKPAGLAVHPGPRTPRSLEDHLHHFRFGFVRDPQPVHRIDRDTSGCLLLARNPRAHKRFARAFEERQVRKTYAAVLEGVPAGDAGTIDLPLAKRSSPREGWKMIGDPRGAAAVTHWRVAAVRHGRALVLFEPETGRTHQLRVHAATGLGLPIAGDPVYGDGKGMMLLHARFLSLPREPKPPVEAVAPLPPSFSAAGFTDADL